MTVDCEREAMLNISGVAILGRPTLLVKIHNCGHESFRSVIDTIPGIGTRAEMSAGSDSCQALFIYYAD